MYTLSFSIVDFENLRWNDKVFDIMLAFPGVEEEESYQPGIKTYTLSPPEEFVETYKFYLIDESLYKIEVVFDSEKVGRAEVKEIYGSIVKKMGKPISQDPINKDLINTKQAGSSRTSGPDNETMAFFKGIDTIDSEGKMIDSKLILEYRDRAMLDVYP